MAHSPEEAGAYQPKDTIGETMKGTAVLGGAGLFVSAVMTALTKKNVGAFAVFSRTGGVAAMFGERIVSRLESTVC